MAGVSGSKWRLPDGADEVRARAGLLSLLGLDETALVDSPRRGGPDSVLVGSEFFKAERDWLDRFAVLGGLTKRGSPARALRVLVRAAIVNRDLLPIPVHWEGQKPPWLAALKPLVKATRLQRWLDGLSDEALADLLVAVESAMRRRQ